MTAPLDPEDLRAGKKIASELSDLFHPGVRPALSDLTAEAHADFSNAIRERIAFSYGPARSDAAASHRLQVDHHIRYAGHHLALRSFLPSKLADYVVSFTANRADHVQQLRHRPLPGEFTARPGFPLPAPDDGSLPPVAGIRVQYPMSHGLGIGMDAIRPRKFFGGLADLEGMPQESRNALMETLVSAFDSFHLSMSRQHHEARVAPQNAGDWVRKVTRGQPTPQDQALRRGQANHLHVRNTVAADLAAHLQPGDARIAADAIARHAAERFGIRHDAALFSSLDDVFHPPVEPEPYRTLHVTLRGGGLVPLVTRR